VVQLPLAILPTMKASVHLSDLRGLARMATDATLGVTNLVETVHRDIARPLGMPRRGIAGLVYGGVRGVTRLVGGGVDALLAPLAARPAKKVPDDSIRSPHLLRQGRPERGAGVGFSEIWALVSNH